MVMEEKQREGEGETRLGSEKREEEDEKRGEAESGGTGGEDTEEVEGVK